MVSECLVISTNWLSRCDCFLGISWKINPMLYINMLNREHLKRQNNPLLIYV